MFNSSDGELYNLWFREALPTYGGPLRYRAHLDCDRCRRGRAQHCPRHRGRLSVSHQINDTSL